VPNKQMVDTIVDNISLRTQRKVELDLQLKVTTTALQLADYSKYIQNETKQLKNVSHVLVYVSEAGKQFHVLHMECLVSMDLEFNEFLALKEKMNVMAIQYANENNIQFATTV
jgi:MscS family membrane protein